MSKARGSMNRPRDAEGRFESTSKASHNDAGAKKSRGQAAQDRCRSDNGRFESCDNKSDNKADKW